MSELNPSEHMDIAGYLLGSLEEHERERFEVHLSSCPRCQGEMSALAETAALLRVPPPAIALPAELAARTFAAVEESALSAPATISAPPPFSPVHEPPPPRAQRAARRRRRTRLYAGAGAAALAVAASVVAVTSGTSHAPAPVKLRLVSDTGTGARGSATVTASARQALVNLEVTGLAVSAPGTSYELFVVGKLGHTQLSSRDWVKLGSFTVTRHGDVLVQFRSLRTLYRHPALVLFASRGNGLTQKVLESASS